MDVSKISLILLTFEKLFLTEKCLDATFFNNIIRISTFNHIECINYAIYEH